MGRKRKETTDDFDFDSVPVEKTVQQPQVIDPVKQALSDPKALLAAALGIDPSEIESLIDAQKQTGMLSVAYEARQHAQLIRSQAEEEQIKRQAGKTAKQRTQEVVDNEWGHEKTPRWRVFHQKNPDLPWKPEPLDLEIPAATEDEAQARYRKVCGIRSTEHYIRAMPMKKFKQKLAEKDAIRDIEEEYRDEIDDFQNPSDDFNSEVTE